MVRIFSFASGTLREWTPSKNKAVLINYLKKLDISGVELTLGTKEELYSFRLSKDNQSWLRSLDYVTIHAPFRLVRKAKNQQEVIKQLDIISKLYDEIKAKNIIIHPLDLPPPEILKKYNFDVSTENLPPKRGITISRFKKIFQKYPQINLCLDVAHAYLYSKYETGILIKAFKNKISQFHLSGTYRKRDHQSLRKVTQDFLFSLRPIKELNVPIIIEQDIKTKGLKHVKEEIRYIKNLLTKDF